mgnify:CR=1 FL=1
MCELFGFTSSNPKEINNYLKTFYSHCDEHPHGWGLSILDDDNYCLVKEPVKADESETLKRILSSPVVGKNIFAHIRLATMGKLKKVNTHPFVEKDSYDRDWTLIHNGTIFDFPELSDYDDVGCGDTDSEKILCYFVDKVNELEKDLGRKSSLEERFNLINDLVAAMAKDNKLNFLLCDGEQIYVHINCQCLLQYLKDAESIVFSTKAISDDMFWQPFPLNTLMSFKDGRLLFKGTSHGQEFIPTAEQISGLFEFTKALHEETGEPLDFDLKELENIGDRFL